MNFDIEMLYNSQRYHFQVEVIQAPAGFQRFKLTGGDRVVVLQWNRPMLKTKGLKHKPPTWLVLEGAIKSEKALEKVKELIVQHLDKVPPAEQAPVLPARPAREQFNNKNPRKKGYEGIPLGERRAKK